METISEELKALSMSTLHSQDVGEEQIGSL